MLLSILQSLFEFFVLLTKLFFIASAFLYEPQETLLEPEKLRFFIFELMD